MLVQRAVTVLFISCILATPLLAGTATLVAPNGSHAVVGGMSITLDPYGAFSSAVYNASAALGSANTTRYSAVMFNDGGSLEFLDQEWRGDIQFNYVGTSSASSSFTSGGLNINLTQSLVNSGQQVRLIQKYAIQNTGPAKSLTFTRYMDADLLFNGNDSDGGASSFAPLVTGEALFIFDSAVSGTTAAPYVGLFMDGGTMPANYYEIDEYWGLFTRVDTGTNLDNTVAASSGGMVTSAGDLAAAMARVVNIASSGNAEFTVVTDFGYAKPNDVRGVSAPEPASMSLLALAGLALVRRRRVAE